MSKDKLTQLSSADEMVEDGTQCVQRMWRHLWQRFDPDGVRFDQTADRVMDGVADGIVAMRWTGGAQVKQVVEMIYALIEETERDPWLFDNLGKGQGKCCEKIV